MTEPMVVIAAVALAILAVLWLVFMLWDGWIEYLVPGPGEDDGA